jgi:hypothetical protein
MPALQLGILDSVEVEGSVLRDDLRLLIRREIVVR